MLGDKQTIVRRFPVAHLEACKLGVVVAQGAVAIVYLNLRAFAESGEREDRHWALRVENELHENEQMKRVKINDASG